MVNVFGFGVIQPCRIRLRPSLDFIERGYKAISLLVREDPRSCNCARPGAVQSQLVREKPAIKLPRPLEFVKRSVWAALEAAAPHFLPFGNGHRTAASSGTVIGRAKRLMKPSASFGL